MRSLFIMSVSQMLTNLFMTPQLKSQISAILAECEACIALSEKATAGPWRATKPQSKRTQISGKNGLQIAAMWNQGATSLDNADFIATSRAFTPKAVRALKETIERLLERIELVSTFSDALSCMQEQQLEQELQSIADTWNET